MQIQSFHFYGDGKQGGHKSGETLQTAQLIFGIYNQFSEEKQEENVKIAPVTTKL